MLLEVAATKARRAALAFRHFAGGVCQLARDMEEAASQPDAGKVRVHEAFQRSQCAACCAVHVQQGPPPASGCLAGIRYARAMRCILNGWLMRYRAKHRCFVA